jgi:hypothetical protein
VPRQERRAAAQRARQAGSSRLLSGITRRVALEIAAADGIPVELRGLRAEELSAIDEAFLTGTSTEVLPIVGIDGQPVGPGDRGPITQLLQERYAVLTKGVAVRSSRRTRPRRRGQSRGRDVPQMGGKTPAMPERVDER